MTHSSIDGHALRDAMRRVPSPVTVVTAAGADEVRGITISSFTSVSLDPPLVAFNVQRTAQMHAVLEQASHFAVHLLSESQVHLSNHFALPDRTGAEQFADVEHRLDAEGTPILADAVIVLRCRPYGFHEAGDHTIVVGEVLRANAGERGEEPLVYYDRSYRQVGEVVAPGYVPPVKRVSSETP